MKLCPPDKCTACGACAAVCPVSCITMKEDAFGAPHPHIGSACIDCGLCSKTCPALNPARLKKVSECYAAFNSDNAERRLSASGGIAALLARSFAGRVYGTAWDECFRAVVKAGNAEEFKGSKYVQSRFSKEVYSEIRQRLGNGEKLLFIGTPCQVAGLLNFTGKAAENLLCADLLCHGVCPETYLAQELARLRKRRTVTAVRFRSNDRYNYHLSLWNGEKCLYDKDKPLQAYLRAFSEGISLRENCYSCPYSKPERCGDITLGDFIGLGGQQSFVAVNSPEGAEAMKLLVSEFPGLVIEERPYAERLVYRPSLLEPVKKSPLRERFLGLYPKYGFYRAVRKTLFKGLLQANALAFYRKIHHIGHIIKTKFK